MFGPFLVKSAAGPLRIIDTEHARRYIQSVDHRARPHWRVAERMIQFAWMSELDNEAAELAFRNALEADDLQVPCGSWASSNKIAEM